MRLALLPAGGAGRERIVVDLRGIATPYSAYAALPTPRTPQIAMAACPFGGLPDKLTVLS
ncbi:hypothetical protein B5P46_20840 [Rhizobium leguminosarum]|uniref:Uncharacterized protein n=1 Tax=Rhizobium leguminosarum TaxID=384 RepID=A0A4Q1TYP4_RHILE|nr:hypothetical protein [Rhizobium leguminosarum]RXT24332.1 hypothetical protein B5P46_20840 [Rhizobium leguminosarum]